MKITRFEDILIWQKAKTLTELIYKNFENCKDYGFKDQIQRASISIMNNIAEGFERNSKKQFVQFLYISKGSSGEVRSMLYVALSLKYLDEKVFNIIYNLIIEIIKLLSGFLKKLKK